MKTIQIKEQSPEFNRHTIGLFNLDKMEKYAIPLNLYELTLLRDAMLNAIEVYLGSELNNEAGLVSKARGEELRFMIDEVLRFEAMFSWLDSIIARVQDIKSAEDEKDHLSRLSPGRLG